MIRKIIGVILIVAGVITGLYVSIVVMFVGGISQIIDAAQKDPVKGSKVAWGVARWVLWVPTGIVTFMIIGIIGGLCFDAGDTALRRKKRAKIVAERRAGRRPGRII